MDLRAKLREAWRISETLQGWTSREGLSGLRSSSTASLLLARHDSVVSHMGLRGVTRKLFADEHYALAVEEAFKYLNNRVKDKSGVAKDGNSLMCEAFKPDSPVLKMNALRTQSERDEQVGYMMILGGCMTGIRNPRAHEHKFRDHPEVALEMLSLANHLVSRVEAAKKSRVKRMP